MDIVLAQKHPLGAAAPGKRKADSNSDDAKKQKTQERQMEALRKKHAKENDKTALFATQQVSPLSTAIATLEKTRPQGEKAQAEAHLLEETEAALNKLRPWLQACKEIGQIADAAKNNGTLPALDFTKDDARSR